MRSQRSLQLAIGEASAAATDPTRWTAFVEAIRAHTNSVAVSLFRPAPLPVGGTLASTGHHPGDVRLYFEHWIHRDPWNLAAQGRSIFTTPGEIRVGADYLSDADFRKTDYYNEHGRFVGAGHKMFLKVCTANDPALPAVHLTLSRTFSEQAFGEDERSSLAQLWPHLNSSVQTWAHLRNADMSRRLGEPCLAMLPLACWVLRADALVDYVNPAAEQLYREGSWLRMAAGKLTAVGDVVPARLANLIRLAAGGLASQHPVLVRTQWGRLRQLALRATPIAESSLFAAAWPHAQVLLSLNVPGDLGREDWVDELDGLTGKQRDVLRLLAGGLRLNDIAERLRIRPGTVKVHLRNIYAATGCQTQADLVRIALTGRLPGL
jgi:DNA-binding CsgD family transcriptional regulator